MEEKVKQLVRHWIYDNLNKILASDDVFIVWSCYILGNRKYMIGITGSDHYFEVTYNKSKGEWYLDVYDKTDNQVIKL